MKKYVFIIILTVFSFLNISCYATETNLLNSNLLTVKQDLETLYYDAAANGKLSSKQMQTLGLIRANADLQGKAGNSNVVPIYYKLGNIYRELGMKEDAIHCYRIIVKRYPYSPIAKKAIVNLKYYGETYSNEYDRTKMIERPEEED